MQLTQYLRYAGLRNTNLSSKRGCAKFLILATAEPHQSTNDRETVGAAPAFAWTGDE